MSLDILDALNQQKIDAYAHQERIICADGLLSVSDEVFKCRMRELGFDKEDIADYMDEPVDIRHKLMERWGE
jgi:hypothetical protein